MQKLRAFVLRLSGLFRSHRDAGDFAAELDSHIALHTEEGIRNGLSSEEARRQALIRLGGAEQAHQALRERGTIPWIENLMQDTRFGLRTLRRSPGFTATAVLTLALGIGACTAIFSVIKPILIDPLPYPQANRLMMLWEVRKDGAPLPVTFATFHGMQQRAHSFEALAAYKPWQAAATTTSQADRPERIEGQRVSADYFRVLGIAPLLGRNFQASDDRVNGPNVVILSDRLWHRRFAADNQIAGKQVRFGNQLYTVIGVMPAAFENVLDTSAEIWAPLQYDPALPADGREWGHHLRMIARLNKGVSVQQAEADLAGAMHAYTPLYAKGYDSTGGAPDGMLVHAMQHDLTQGVRPALLAVLGAVLLVLLIACVNVANLLLARGSQRGAEFAMRTALGAPRSRVARQLITEALLLAMFGCALGMAVAEAGVRALLVLSPPGLPRLNAVSVDGAVLLFAFALTTLIGVFTGVASSWQASRNQLHAAMRHASNRATGSRHAKRRILVITEVSLSVVLLVTAGLLLRSMQRLLAVDPGFDTSGLLTMQVQDASRRSVGSAARSGDARLQFFTQALQQIRSVPGVVSAAFTSQLPLNGDEDVYGIQFENDNNRLADPAFRYAVSPGYLETMHIPLLRGRVLTEQDAPGAPVAVLISQSLAERKFAGSNPIGRHVRVGLDAGHADRPWATIVGVVGNVRQQSLAIADEDAFYITTGQWAWEDEVQSLVVRTHADPASLAPSVQRAIWSVDKDCPISQVATMDAVLAATAVQRRFVLILFEAFGLVALVLAAIGIYGILAGSVAERTREIGVRAALGATRADILTLVLRQGMTMTFMGLAVGLCAALIAARALNAMLFGVTWLDRLTYLCATLALIAVSAIACLIPARRAASIDPMEALRTD
jgi:putative ABC transport system permease protein